jgi:hypothetical protein
MSYYDAARGAAPCRRVVLLVAMPPDQAERIVQATLQNIDDWERRLEDIERAAAPGDKARVLALLRDVVQVRASLRRLAGLPDQ